MNKVTLFNILAIIFLLWSCQCDDCEGGDGNYIVQVTINFINDTSDKIRSLDGCNRDINPKSTLTFKIKGNLGRKPSVDNFPVSIFSNCNMMYKDGNILKCEDKVEDIKNYEVRKELSPSVFELTFRFTEERKAHAKPCIENVSND